MLGRRKNNNITQEKNVPLPEDFKLLSKTTTDNNGKSVPGIDVATHCIIAGLIAREIIKTLPESIRFLFPEGTALVAALHDIGKANPDFQKMIYQAIDDNLPECLQNANADNAKRKGTSFHALASQVILRKSCQNKYIPIIEGMHHGFRPAANIAMYTPDYGGEAWNKKRQEIMWAVISAVMGNKKNSVWPEINSWEQACAIGGLVITADWLASGGKFASLKLEDSGNGYEEQAKESVQNAGFHQLNIKKELSFKEVFGFEMNKEQEAFCGKVNSPGVYVLEAPMGIGKTEAALYAAYKSMEQGYARGIYFAMPTQLTSNKIYERVGAFLDEICENWQENKDDGHLQLLHGNAWLYTATENNSDDYHNAEIRSWFDGRKKGILAPFAVGTVDQALMAAMEVRHGMLRSFGLAGKVVILDEIHSYDAYTGTLLNRLVEMLRKTGCTVILLSATLTSGQKKEILGKENVLNEEQYKSVAYPLITGFKADKGQAKQGSGFACPVYCGEKQQGKSADTEISFAKVSDDGQKKSCINEAVEKASSGQQVLWIENTVAEAQEIFKAVSALCKGKDIECGLIHSRFTRLRRSENEEYWVNIYGKKGKDRCRKHILVGTQVLEQSIDIDADFLITHICPMDMLLQRMGRLWRHSGNDEIRPEGTKRHTVIISPKNYLEKNSFGVSEYVYSKYVLCRTMETLKDKTAVRIPDDIRGLMESTYSDRQENGKMQEYLKELNKKREELRQYASMAESKSDKQNKTESDFKPCTRYSETESVNVIMLKSLEKKEEGYNVVFEDSTELFIPQKTDRPDIQKISKIIIEHTVSVAEYDAPDYYDSLTGIFSKYVYTGDGDEHPFRAVFLDKDGYVSSDMDGNHCRSKGCEMLYDNILGYRKTKKDIK
ncbi:MAG: CRISPR-associated helicase Cas3' [Elusimicrobiales bacterium]|nr:CRISPR-associated helicase Cas3' [Elusimicrobiales bacterium]